MIDDASRSLRDWRSTVIDAALEVLAQPEHYKFESPAPVMVTCEFYLKRPLNQTRKQKAQTAVARKPDVDKLARGVLDALSIAGVFDDDAQVALLFASKAYADNRPTGAHVSVAPLVAEDGVRIRMPDEEQLRDEHENGDHEHGVVFGCPECDYAMDEFFEKED
jgi:Holliday junction resolvase RusA-like endonuclease